jgi:hypothetical protein
MNRSKKIGARSASTPSVGFPAGDGVSVAVAELPAESTQDGGADELFWEDRVAARMGLAREKISALREAHLVAGDDFVLRGNAVVLTAAGLSHLERVLCAPAVSTLAVADRPATVTAQPAPSHHAPLPHPPPLAPALPAVACRPERLRVVVARTLPNRHLIYVWPATVPPTQRSAAPLLLCRVKDNAHFHPRLAAFEIIRSADGQWFYLGRLPRSLGRW